VDPRPDGKGGRRGATAGRLRSRRLELGLAQTVVADAVGLSRQALSALEAGRASPSLATALALARLLGTSVEALFGPDPDDAAPAGEAWLGDAGTDGRAKWARIAGRLVLRPAGPDEEPDALLRADGRLSPLPGAVDPDRAVWLGGCDPALALFARALARVAPDLAPTALPMTSAEAEAALRQGRLHVASVHGPAPAAPGPSLPYAVWREGFLLAPGLDAADLERRRLRWALRPPGATARALFDRHRPRLRPRAVLVAAGHWQVAEAIRGGQADVGVAIEAAAAAHGLRFVPLEREVVRLELHDAVRTALERPLVRAAGDPRLRAAALSLAGYVLTAP
jgi:putative molybdopterin biosynthesis protein